MPLVLQPPFLTMLIVVGAGLIQFLLGPWDTLLRMPMVGLVLMALGFCVMLWARRHVTSRKTTLFVGRPSSQLVCEGPFRFTRNPMYVGVVISLLGMALWVGTVPLYMAAPLAFLIFNTVHIPHEERMLRDVFGARYLAYAKEVRRWL